MRNLPHPEQGDFFQEPVFETRSPSETLDVERFRARLNRGMSAAIRNCGRNRQAISDDMARLTGSAVSKAMLDAYTSEAKPHDISLVRFKALVRAVNAPGLWDLAVSDEGLIILQGDEARLAEIARLQQEQRSIGKRLKTLQSVPVDIKALSTALSRKGGADPR